MSSAISLVLSPPTVGTPRIELVPFSVTGMANCVNHWASGCTLPLICVAIGRPTTIPQLVICICRVPMATPFILGALVAMLLASALVYSCLFSIGYWIYANYTAATMTSLFAFLLAFVLIRQVRKIKLL